MPPESKTDRLRQLSALFAATALLGGCGGSDSPAPASASPPAPSLTLSGVVARGAAVANAGVAAKCNGGTGTATSSATGAYSIALAAGSLPCTLKATASGSTAGNALDQSLDTLNAKLASSGVTLAQLTTTLLQNRPAGHPQRHALGGTGGGAAAHGRHLRRLPRRRR